MFELATTAKQCDDKLRALLRQGKTTVLYYPPRGREIIAAGHGVSLDPGDYVVNIYRGLHDHIAKGVDLGELLSEMLGKETAPAAAGGTHPCDRS